MKQRPGAHFTMVIKRYEPNLHLEDVMFRVKRTMDVVAIGDKIAIIRNDLRPTELQNTVARFVEGFGFAEALPDTPITTHSYLNPMVIIHPSPPM